ncbi:MAG: HlyD family efflux transporter periplasmic adaptor subunit [Planctomycetes bacterium]|nr:HlyD family efflux transporter periplasmic adaptor subunit [Planctomycetota bacterium]
MLRATRKTGIIAAGLVLALAAGGVWALRSGSSNPGGSSDSDVLPTSDTAEITRASFDITTLATGELEAKKQVEIRSRVEQQAVIQEIIPEGTRVKEGDVLIRLNADRIQTAIDEQLLQIETAKSELVAAENGYNIQVNENANNLRNAELKVTLAKLSLQQWLEGEVKTKREANRLALSQSKLELDRLAEKVIRSQKLQEQGFLSKDELERDELEYIKNQSAWIKAQLDDRVYEDFQFPKDQKQKQGDLEQANSELVKVKMNAEIDLASKAAQRNNKRTQLTIRENSLNKLRQQLDASTIKAPSGGLVVYATSMRRNMWGGNDGPLQIGRQVYPNELLIVLPDTSEMVASVQVHESLAGDVKPGMAAAIKVDAANGSVFRGTVDSIGVLAESGGWRDPDRREYTVKIKIEGEEDISLLKPSMRCEARLTMGRIENAVALPVQGVFTDGPVRFVYAKKAGRYERIPIKLGKRSDTFAEVLAGVEPGRTVLLRDPAPAEVLAGAWDKASLEVAGYTLDDKGNPIMKDGGKPASGQARTADSKSSAPKTAESKSVESKTAETKPAETATASAAETKPALTAKPEDAKADRKQPGGSATPK